MEIADIKQKLPLSQVLGHYGLSPDKNQRLCCPFHDDKTPSMQVYPKTNTVYCFSSNCKTHGKSLDVVDFIMHKDGITKHEAILKAQTMLGGESNEGGAQIKPNPKREEILQTMFGYFKNAVHNSHPAQDYIKSRGLDATRLEIGYNTAQFHHGTRRDEALIEKCVAVGLLSPWGNNTRKAGEQAYKAFGKECICFALRDRGNHITGLYFRSIHGPSLGGVGEAKHFYLKESTGLYPSYPSPNTEKLIIAESIIDTASLLQIEAITKKHSLLSAYGTNRLNEEMKSAIKEWCLSGAENKEIIFAFDNDDAGNKAVEKYSMELKDLLPNVVFSKLELPCKDVNETLLAHNEQVFAHLFEKRIFLFSNEKPVVAEADIPPLSHFDTSNPDKIIYTADAATYYVLGGLPKQLDTMKVMLQVQNWNGYKARNKVDLYEDKQVASLCLAVSEKLGTKREALEKDIYKLTELLEKHREKEEKPVRARGTAPHYFTARERSELETFLKAPNVIQRLNELLGKTGIVGEERNRIFLLLIAISHKTKDPLHALVQGSSGSGKTKIVRQISDCAPQEHVSRFTRISDKALYNYPEHYFANRLLVIEDMDGLGEDAGMAFRELQSSGELRSSVSIKLENGTITGGEKVVSGPIASMSCTTKGEVYEDNMGRVFLLAVDEGMEQTKRIIAHQNQKASGKINGKEEQGAKQFIQNIIRIIEAKEVINPFAEQLQLPEEAHKIRRLNDLFQNFIKMITLANQYQRKQNGQGKLIAELEDISIAIDIMFESIVLKVDELDGSLRQFFEKLKSYVEKKGNGHSFDRFEVREAAGLGKTQQHVYLTRLVELEYIQQSGFANRGFKYKITHWDDHKVLRERIKNGLQKQMERLVGEHQTNANRTPERHENGQ